MFKFLGNYAKVKALTQTEVQQKRYSGTIEALNKMTKEQLVQTVLTLAVMAAESEKQLNKQQEQKALTMNVLTEKALAAMIVIAQVGQGIPLYLFEGHDTIDAIAGGFVEIKDDALYLTKKGIAVLEELEQTGDINSVETELSTANKKVQ